MHFQALPYQEQLTLVWQSGTLLASRRLPGFGLHLYAVNSFYVELWICQQTYTATLLYSFSKTQNLEPYLENIVLGPIYSL